MGEIYDILKKAKGNLDDKAVAKVVTKVRAARKTDTGSSNLDALVTDSFDELTGWAEVDAAFYQDIITAEQREALAEAVLKG